MLLLVLGLIQSITAQPVQSTIMNTASLLRQQPSIYPIGYLPPSLINPTTNASACRKVSMFKFPASVSGTPSLLKLNFPPNPNPNPNPETCTLGLSLFNFQNNSQIGYTFMSSFNTNTNNTVDVSKSMWSFVRGSLYYLQIQTSTNGPSCIVRLPYATQQVSPGSGTAGGTAAPPTYAIVVSQGPLNQPCGSSPWTSVAAIDGGYIPMEIWLQQALAPTATATSTPSQTPTPSPSSTGTPSPSSTGTPSPSSTDTPSPSASQTPSASITASPTPNQLIFTASQTPTLYSPSSSNSPTSSITLSYTASPTPTANSNLLNPQSNGLSSGTAASPPTQNGATIAGGVIGALVLAAAATAGIIYYKNRHYVKQSRSPVTSSSVIVYNPVQMQASESTIYAHHV